MKGESNVRNWNWKFSIDYAKPLDWALRAWIIMMVAGYLWHEEGFGSPLGFVACVLVVILIDFVPKTILYYKHERSV